MPPRVVNRGIIGNLTPENMNFSVASQPESPGGSGKTYRALGVFMFASPLTATFFVSVRATHSVPAPCLVLHWSYERSGSEAQTT